MLFEFSLLKGTITLLYITMPIQDFFAYMGALITLYQNYRINCKHLELAAAGQEAFVREAKRKYIRDNAKAYYLTVKKLAEITENQVDDKLVLYIEKFAEGMKAVFGNGPTTEERDLMSVKAEEIHSEVKAAEKSAPKENV